MSAKLGACPLIAFASVDVSPKCHYYRWSQRNPNPALQLYSYILHIFTFPLPFRVLDVDAPPLSTLCRCRARMWPSANAVKQTVINWKWNQNDEIMIEWEYVKMHLKFHHFMAQEDQQDFKIIFLNLWIFLLTSTSFGSQVIATPISCVALDALKWISLRAVPMTCRYLALWLDLL